MQPLPPLAYHTESHSLKSLYCCRSKPNETALYCTAVPLPPPFVPSSRHTSIISPSRQLEGSGDDASYFVVSDKSRVRVEALLLFHESQAPGQLAASATQPNAGAIGRALARVSSSSGISCEGTGGGTVDGNPSGKRGRNSDGGDAGGVVRRIRNWMGEGVLEVSSPWGVFASLGVGVVSTAIAFAVGLCLPLFLGSSHGRQH